MTDRKNLVDALGRSISASSERRSVYNIISNISVQLSILVAVLSAVFVIRYLALDEAASSRFLIRALESPFIFRTLVTFAGLSAGLWAVGAFANKYTQSVNGKRAFLGSAVGLAFYTLLLVVQLPPLLLAPPLMIVIMAIAVTAAFNVSAIAKRRRQRRRDLRNTILDEMLLLTSRSQALQTAILEELRDARA